MKHLLRLSRWAAGITAACGLAAAAQAAGPTLTNAILFCTQVPQPGDFVTLTSTFGNHRGDVESAPRGGGLWIRYADGSLKNLTATAGYGQSGFQGAQSIAVREPNVHWSGNKAVFSMVVGWVPERYQQKTYYWQMYEVTNIWPGQTPIITKVANQPTNYNNVSPIYGTDDRILFTSDRTRSGARHLYPQLDEYEEAPTVTGIWSLNPTNGHLFMLNHTPSGAFTPTVDSFGRVIFTRWDHLQRDQQADADADEDGQAYGTFNYSDESANALILTNNRSEVFPEPREAVGQTNRLVFNQFFPWQITEDGLEEETVNHLGRHELGGEYAPRVFNNDPNLQNLDSFAGKFNTKTFQNFLQIKESPVVPGLYYGTAAPEFGTHAAGQLLTLSAHIATNADFCRVDYLTPIETRTADDTPNTNLHFGLSRSPLPMSDGSLVAIHTPETREDKEIGTDGISASRYDFRLKQFQFTNGYWRPGPLLTPGFTNVVWWWDPDNAVTNSGPLWELDPVEVRARPRPARLVPHLEAPEQKAFAEEGVDPVAVQRYLQANNLALIVSRNVTARDTNDLLQPYNLRVPGGTQTVPKSGKVYDIAHFQIYQGDQIRGLGIRNPGDEPRDGRRVLAQRLHDPVADNVPNPTGPAGSVQIAADGSVAAVVPARRALSWQTTSPTGTAVVRERYWLSFQSGEIRTCAACHGLNRRDQAGQPTPTNTPLALKEFLRQWKTNNLPQVSRVQSGGTNYLAIAFKRNKAATNLTHTVELSGNLAQWQPGSSYAVNLTNAVTALTTEISRTPLGTNLETIVVRDNQPITAGTNRFLRVKVSAP